MASSKKLSKEDHNIAAVTAAVLRQGRLMHYASLMLSVFAMIQLLLLHAAECRLSGTALWLPMLALLLGLAELVFAMRVALDARLFGTIENNTLSASDLDDALLRLGLIHRKTDPRSMQNRAKGALRLIKLQTLCLTCQTLALIPGLGG